MTDRPHKRRYMMYIPGLSTALALALPLLSSSAPVVEDASDRPRQRALKADDNVMASYDKALRIPKCSSEGSSCDTGDLVSGRGNIHPEPNFPNTLGNCGDGPGGNIGDESVDQIVVSSESGGFMMEDERARITAYVNCWMDGYDNDYVYFYYVSDGGANSNWNFIERIQCTGGGRQTLSTSYTLPKGSSHAVRVSMRHISDDDTTSNDGICGVGPFDDNDDVAFMVAPNPSSTGTDSPTSQRTMFPTASMSKPPTAPQSSSPTTPVPTHHDPTLSSSASPSVHASVTPSLRPTYVPTHSPSKVPPHSPSKSPTHTPSKAPTHSPSKAPTHTPSKTPTSSTPIPTNPPQLSPSDSPFVLFTYGESLYRDNALNIQISVGLTAKQIAQTGQRVSIANGGQSCIQYHGMMDGAGIAPLPDGGYAYLSNAEKSSGRGGVYGLYFNKHGEIIDYKALLTGTSRNCGGGMSPWNTWISCEEVSGGQCWQVEPDPSKPNHSSPRRTLLGGLDGGAYETVAVDNTNKNKPIFFTTKDSSNGELRRFEADGNGWDALHEGGQTSYLQFQSGNRFQWTTNLAAGKNSAAQYYPNAEGIIYHNSTLYFVAKVTRTLFILDLDDMTYTSEVTGSSWVGQGAFNSQPDQIIENDLDKRKFIYFTEDGGNAPGVHVRDREGKYHTMARAVPGGRYAGDETVGIAFSPDRKKFYFGFQDAGVLMEVTRDDGQSFN